MTGDRSLFVDLKLITSSRKHLTFGDTNKGKVIELGKVAISKEKHIACLFNLLDFQSSVHFKFCDMGMMVLFTKSRCVVFMQNDNTFIFEGVENVIYIL